MRFDMEHSGELATLQGLSDRGTYVKQLDDVPRILPIADFYWHAFWSMHNDRPFGMGVGRIGFMVIDAYAKRYDIEGADFETFSYIIKAVDSVFMSYQNKK